MKKVAFHTLGCKLNFAETSSIVRTFKENGFEKVELVNKPNVYVINTCSVTDNADKKCQKLVKEALKISPSAFIIITGCYAQLKPKEISNIPGVDAVLGSNEKFKMIDLISNFEKGTRAQIHVSSIKESKSFEHAHSENDRTRTFLKIQDGCNYYCSFCTIPFARGTSRSDNIENIINRIKVVINKGTKEIVLTGVNIGDFGLINGKRESTFYQLIQEIDKINGDVRFRISSIEPNLLNDEIIEFVASSKKFVPHFHIPLQSGNNYILKAMRRRYNKELYASRVSKIKSLLPDCCIGADVIVGFPGETKEYFYETYNFLKDLDISYLHVFPYSERPNTRAIAMDGIVSIMERTERAKMLRILSEKKKRRFYEENIGKIKKVLFEQEENQGKMNGFTENYIKVTTPYNEELINTVQEVMLDEIDLKGLMKISNLIIENS